MSTIAWNTDTGRMDTMSDAEYKKHLQEKFAPIDPMWEKAATWCRMGSKPVVVKLNLLGQELYYVVSSTRVWTHRTFAALAASYKWNINPTPTMKDALYKDAINQNMVGKKYDNSTLGEHAGHWWFQAGRELHFNCHEWLEKTTDKELLQFLDIKNFKFEHAYNTYRTDGYINYSSVMTNPCAEVTLKAKDTMF